MKSHPFVRIAASLCLIATMVIQPMAIVVAQGTCSKRQCGQATSVCQACKCCKVKPDGDLCGCCSGREVDAVGCCTKKEDPPKQVKLHREVPDIVSEPPKSNHEELKQERLALSSCLCGVHTEPIAPAPHRVPVPQFRDLVVIAYLDHVVSDVGLSILPARVNSRPSIGDLSPHYSQRFLCVWRI